MSSSKRFLTTLAQLGYLVLALASATACADGDPDPSTGPAGPNERVDQQSGSLTIKLSAQSDVTFSSFSYAIVRPGFTKAGNIDVSHSKTVSTTIAGLPPETGYTLTLMGQSSAPVEANCSGSATFDVTAGHVTQVPVGIACHVNEVTPPPPPPADGVAQAPLPPLAPFALGVLLAAAGATQLGRRRRG